MSSNTFHPVTVTSTDANDYISLDYYSQIIDSLVDLYLNVKVRSKADIQNYTKSDLQAERENLQGTDALTLI